MLIPRSNAKFPGGALWAGNFQERFGQFAEFIASRDASQAVPGVLRVDFFHTPSLTKISYAKHEYRN